MNLSMIHGDSKSLTISCTRGGTAVPLVTGDVVYFTVKKRIDSAEKILQKTITVFTDGKAIIEILPSDKAAFGDLRHEANYKYDVQVNFAAGSVKTIIAPSTFTIMPGVTDE